MKKYTVNKSRFLKKELTSQHTFLKKALGFLSESPFYFQDSLDGIKKTLSNEEFTLLKSDEHSCVYSSKKSQQQCIITSCNKLIIQNFDKKSSIKEIHFLAENHSSEEEMSISSIFFTNGDSLVKSGAKYSYNSTRTRKMTFYYDEYLFFSHDIPMDKDFLSAFAENFNFPFFILRFRTIILRHESELKPIGYKFYRGNLKTVFWTHRELKKIPAKIHKPTTLIFPKNKKPYFEFVHFKDGFAVNYTQKILDFFEENDLKPTSNFNLPSEEAELVAINGIIDV